MVERQNLGKIQSCTMTDVAKAAGVSQSTVSLALRNSPLLPPETKEKVIKVAQSLGYRPNPMVSALMTSLRAAGKKKRGGGCSIAFLRTQVGGIPWQRKILHDKYLKGARERGEKLGYRVESYTLDEPGMNLKRLEKVIRTRGVEGILIAPLPKALVPMEMDWSYFAVAALGYTIAEHFSVAAHHHFGNMLTALENLEAQGYQRVGFCISDDLNTRVGRIWAAAYLQSHLGKPRRRNVPVCLYPSDGFEKTFAAWMDKYRPDAIISAHGPPWMETLRKMNYSVPEDVGFVTMSHHHEHDNYSGVDECAEDLGALGVELLIEQLNRNERGIPERRKIVLQDGVWRQGWTTRGVLEQSEKKRVSGWGNSH
jgi:LacI family transcriptional regulator